MPSSNIAGEQFTFTIPWGITRLTGIECIGAGGGGGDGYSTVATGFTGTSRQKWGGCSGGAGAYASVGVTTILAVTPLSSVMYTRGKGGDPEGDGGSSTAYVSGNYTVTAAGGKGGKSANGGAIGAGGQDVDSTGESTFSGGSGASGWMWSPSESPPVAPPPPQNGWGAGGGGSGGIQGPGNYGNGSDFGPGDTNIGGLDGDGSSDGQGGRGSQTPGGNALNCPTGSYGGGGGGGGAPTKTAAGGSGAAGEDGMVWIAW